MKANLCLRLSQNLVIICLIYMRVHPPDWAVLAVVCCSPLTSSLLIHVACIASVLHARTSCFGRRARAQSVPRYRRGTSLARLRRSSMASSELDIGEEVAEPYRFNFEIAWEVANKGQIRQRQASVDNKHCASQLVNNLECYP